MVSMLPTLALVAGDPKACPWTSALQGWAEASNWMPVGGIAARRRFEDRSPHGAVGQSSRGTAK
jgi:hypothetical protein